MLLVLHMRRWVYSCVQGVRCSWFVADGMRCGCAASAFSPGNSATKTNKAAMESGEGRLRGSESSDDAEGGGRSSLVLCEAMQCSEGKKRRPMRCASALSAPR